MLYEVITLTEQLDALKKTTKTAGEEALIAAGALDKLGGHADKSNQDLKDLEQQQKQTAETGSATMVQFATAWMNASDIASMSIAQINASYNFV